MASPIPERSGKFESFQDDPLDQVDNVISIVTPDSPDKNVVVVPSDSFADMTTLDLLQKYWMIIGVYILSHSTMGLGMSLIGPALNILGRQVGVTSTSKLSAIFVARAIGFLIGTVAGGQVIDRYGRRIGQFFTCFCLLASALITSAYPWMTSLFGLCVLSFFAAVVMGANDNLLQVLLLALFKDKSPPFMQALHAGFALGAFLAPLFVAGFLDGEDEYGIATGPYEWSFYTMGIYTVIVTTVATTITCLGKVPAEAPKIPTETAEDTTGVQLDDLSAVEQGEASPTASDRPPRQGLCGRLRDIWATGAKNKNGFHGTGMVLVALGAVLLWLYVGSETGYGNLISSYATKMGYMGETDAALLASVFWGFFLVGRVMGVGLSLRFPSELLITIDLVAAVVSVFIMTVSGSVTLLWVCSGALGMAVGSLYAAMVTWIDQVVEMSGQVLSILVVFVCIGQAIFPLIMSVAMDIHPHSMIIFHLVVLTGCCIMFFFMRAYRKKHTD